MNATTQAQDWKQSVTDTARHERERREWEAREFQAHARLIQEVESAPLHERKQNTVEWLSYATLHPEIIARTVDYILAGNYGHGAMQAGRAIVHSPRMNQVAALTIMAAQLEWRAPAAMVRKAWKGMPATYQSLLDKAVREQLV